MEKKIAMVAILCGMLAAVFRHNKWIAIPALLIGFAIGLLALFGAFD